jgi:hypothetical protein
MGRFLSFIKKVESTKVAKGGSMQPPLLLELIGLSRSTGPVFHFDNKKM